jgi:hypothetical protein
MNAGPAVPPAADVLEAFGLGKPGAHPEPAAQVGRPQGPAPSPQSGRPFSA